MIHILEALQFVIEKEGDTITAVVPSYRGDCTEMPDIAEEIARVYGYEHIPSTRPVTPISKGEAGFTFDVTERISSILSSAGLNETVTFSFMHPDQLKKLLFKEDDSVYNAVPILNPITEDFPLMRTTLLPTLMDVLARNQAVKNESVAIYEIAPVYQPKQLPLTELPDQELYVTGLLYGKRTVSQWPNKAEAYDFYDVKGIVEAILEGLGVTPDYHKVAKFPAIHRDLAFLAPIDTKNSQIVSVLKEKGGDYLEGVYLFDLYQGKQVPQGFKSLAYSLQFRSEEGTLTDQDIEGPIKDIVEELKNTLHCELR